MDDDVKLIAVVHWYLKTMYGPSTIKSMVYGRIKHFLERSCLSLTCRFYILQCMLPIYFFIFFPFCLEMLNGLSEVE